METLSTLCPLDLVWDSIRGRRFEPEVNQTAGKTQGPLLANPLPELGAAGC
jgi:hypothetical protein